MFKGFDIKHLAHLVYFNDFFLYLNCTCEFSPFFISADLLSPSHDVFLVSTFYAPDHRPAPPSLHPIPRSSHPTAKKHLHVLIPAHRSRSLCSGHRCHPRRQCRSSPELRALQLVSGSVTSLRFYRPSSNASTSAGSLLKLEVDANASAYTLPPQTAISQILYQTETLNGTLVPASAAILWPYAPRQLEDGSYPVVSWAHATSGIFPECGRSHVRNL